MLKITYIEDELAGSARPLRLRFWQRDL